MDVDTVLLSVRERDNWRRRLELLEQTLTEIRDRRSAMEVQMKRLRKDLQRLSRSTGVPARPSSASPPRRTLHDRNAQQLAR
jgi:septal ring factor EnvC (AmiA/AmiB activator)